MVGGDGSRVGLVLENLLDAQQRRTDAEREYVTMQSDYMLSLVELQRAMGTLLQYEGINAVRSRGQSTVDFVLASPPESPGQSKIAGQTPSEQPIIAKPKVNAVTPGLQATLQNETQSTTLETTVKR